MPAVIVKDVHERTTYLERRREYSRVIAIRKNGAATLMVAVHAPCDAHPEALHGARQLLSPRRLNKEMEMIRLQGKVHQTHSEPNLRCTKRLENGPC
jgi:hypothetical protein